MKDNEKSLAELSGIERGIKLAAAMLIPETLSEINVEHGLIEIK